MQKILSPLNKAFSGMAIYVKSILQKRAKMLVYSSFLLLFLAFSSPMDTVKDQAILTVMMSGLEQIHYKPLKINDDFSQKAYDLYLKRLDAGKRFFLKEDIDALKKYRSEIDNNIQDGSFEFFDKANSLLDTRVAEAQTYYREILEKPFDFTVNETVELDGDKIDFSKDKNELKERWRKYLKYQSMLHLITQLDIQDKDNSEAKKKTMAELEADARKKSLQSQDEYFKTIGQLEHDDKIGMYFNTIANVYDPHTEYFPPREKEDFDISMSGQLEGIGAQLQEKDGFIKVSSIVVGSASWKQGELKAGDIILKVAQGSGEAVDVVNMRLDKVVSQIRGKKGTEVRLTVKKPDGTITIIPIIREVVVIEDTYAQGALIKGADGKKNIGYIKLPVFYADFNEKGGRSCSEDVKKLLIDLKNAGAQGIVLDLRNNGGGSLDDVVKMAGLFIEKGPIVQVKSKTGAPHVLEDKDASVVYDGPLVVMVNNLSASASEIMAAAVQDYKRGVILGSKSTFGKGTVQRFFDLDEYLSNKYNNLKPIGSVKMTMQKFYRINGESTQLRGVESDVEVADIYSYMGIGEKEQDYAMEWDKIASSDYKKWKNPVPDNIISKSKQRISGSADFKLLEEQAQEMKKGERQTKYTLNLEEFRAEQKKEKEEKKKYDAIGKNFAEMQMQILNEDNRKIITDSAKAEKQKQFTQPLQKDAHLHEALNIINDWK